MWNWRSRIWVLLQVLIFLMFSMYVGLMKTEVFGEYVRLWFRWLCVILRNDFSSLDWTRLCS